MIMGSKTLFSLLWPLFYGLNPKLKEALNPESRTNSWSKKQAQTPTEFWNTMNNFFEAGSLKEPL